MCPSTVESWHHSLPAARQDLCTEGESKVSLHGSAASSLPRHKTMLLCLLIISFCHAVYPGFRVLKAGTKRVCELWGSDLTAPSLIAIPLLGKILKLPLSKGAITLVCLLAHFEQTCHGFPVEMGNRAGACSHCGPLKIDMQQLRHDKKGSKKTLCQTPISITQHTLYFLIVHLCSSHSTRTFGLWATLPTFHLTE